MYVNVNNILRFIELMHIIAIIDIKQFIGTQLDFRPADIKYSLLRTMARLVRRTVLSGKREVFAILTLYTLRDIFPFIGKTSYCARIG